MNGGGGDNFGPNGQTQRREPHVRRIFHDVEDALPGFDPVEDDMNILDWIDKMEEYGDLYEWDEVAITHFALMKLHGVARKWRDSLPSKNRSWEEWKVILLATFPSGKSDVELRISAENYKRKTNQHVTEYFFEKLSLCNKARMCEEEAIEWIVRGLENNRFRDYLGPLQKYKHPSELLPDIKSADSYIRRFEDSVIVNEVFVEESRSGSYRNERISEFSCFRCSGKGHYARDCPERNNLSDCGSSGSTKENCEESSSSGSADEEIGLGSSVERSENMIQMIGSHVKYFKEAFINGTPIKSYIDLGSSCVTIRLEDAECNGFTFMELDDLQPLVGYGNGIVKPLGIFSAKITVDGVEAKCKIHVVPNSMQVVPLLIGHPFTEQKHVSVASDSNGLRINTVAVEFVESDLNHVSSFNYMGHLTFVGCKSEVVPEVIVGVEEFVVPEMFSLFEEVVAEKVEESVNQKVCEKVEEPVGQTVADKVEESVNQEVFVEKVEVTVIVEQFEEFVKLEDICYEVGVPAEEDLIDKLNEFSYLDVSGIIIEVNGCNEVEMDVELFDTSQRDQLSSFVVVNVEVLVNHGKLEKVVEGIKLQESNTTIEKGEVKYFERRKDLLSSLDGLVAGSKCFVKSVSKAVEWLYKKRKKVYIVEAEVQV